MAERNVLVVMRMLANCWKADSCSKMNMAIYYPKA